LNSRRNAPSWPATVCAAAARGAGLDGHHDGFQGLAGGDILDRRRVLGQFREPGRLGELQVRNDQPLHRVRGMMPHA
jgi:hypothetical protein